MSHNARVRQIGGHESAVSELKRLEVDPHGIDIMSPKSLFYTIRLDEVDCRAAVIMKQEMLSAGGDAATSWGTVDLRDEGTGVLLMGTKRQYDRVLKKLRMQPYGLKGMADEIEEAIGNYERDTWNIKCREHELVLGERTLLMSILNVTPDSFSDGGRWDKPEEAAAHAKRMVEQGADIIDIGGESTRPFSEPLTAEEELKRVMPVLERLVKETDVPVSIDTHKPEVARKALEAGAHMVNDVYGLRQEGMAEVISEFDVPVVIMHMLGTPKTMQEEPRYEDAVGDILRFLRERVDFAVSKGIPKDRMIIDPGIGFGKTLEHNLEIIRRLREFKSLGLPILIGPSRKSFIGKILDLPVEERLEGTLSGIIASILNGAGIVRVHDVLECKRAAVVADTIVHG